MPSTKFPPGFAAGVRHFNAGRFFEAHEAFEDLLDEVETDDRWDLLVALIQVAVGYHKAASGHPGSNKMLRLGAEKLAPFGPVAHGVDVQALRDRLTQDQAILEAGQSLAPHLATAPPRMRLRRREAS